MKQMLQMQFSQSYCAERQLRRICAAFGVSAQEPGESGVPDVNREL